MELRTNRFDSIFVEMIDSFLIIVDMSFLSEFIVSTILNEDTIDLHDESFIEIIDFIIEAFS